MNSNININCKEIKCSNTVNKDSWLWLGEKVGKEKLEKEKLEKAKQNKQIVKCQQ